MHDVNPAERILGVEGGGTKTAWALVEREGNELRIVDMADVDPALLEETTVEADRILAADPQLESPEHASLEQAVADLWRRYALA